MPRPSHISLNSFLMGPMQKALSTAILCRMRHCPPKVSTLLITLMASSLRDSFSRKTALGKKKGFGVHILSNPFLLPFVSDKIGVNVMPNAKVPETSQPAVSLKPPNLHRDRVLLCSSSSCLSLPTVRNSNGIQT